MDWIEVELINKYKSGDPDLFNASLTNSFNAYLTAISESPVTIPDAAAYASGTYNDNPEGQAAYLKTAFNNKKNAVTTAGAGTRGDISYFAGGVSYYKIMIKHDDTDAAINELGEFGVVRNSVYDVNITAINNPGTPVIPDPDPTIPDESDKYYLSVQINVNPWTWYTQEEIL